jgi:hypothetical protein
MKENGNNGHVDGDAQLEWHKLHLGLYARVAKRLRVNPSYVSRVARGKRQNEDVKRALLHELHRISLLRPDVKQVSRRAQRA